MKGLCAAKVRVRVQRARSIPHGGALENFSPHQLPFLLVDLCVDILNRSSWDNRTLPANATSSMIEFWEYVIVFPLFRLSLIQRLQRQQCLGGGLCVCRSKRGATSQIGTRGAQGAAKGMGTEPRVRGLGTPQRQLAVSLPSGAHMHLEGVFPFWH